MTFRRHQAVSFYGGEVVPWDWRDGPPRGVVTNDPTRESAAAIRVLHGEIAGARPGEIVLVAPGIPSVGGLGASRRSLTSDDVDPFIAPRRREHQVHPMPTRWRYGRGRAAPPRLLSSGRPRFLQLARRRATITMHNDPRGVMVDRVDVDRPVEFLELLSGLHVVDAFAVGGDYDHSDHDVHRLFGFDSLILRIDGNVYRFFYGNEADDYKMGDWRLDRHALLRELNDGLIDYDGEICMEIAEPGDRWIHDHVRPVDPVTCEIRGRCTCTLKRPNCVDYLYGVDEAGDGSRVVFEVGITAPGIPVSILIPRRDARPRHPSGAPGAATRPSWTSRWSSTGFVPLWLQQATQEGA